MTSEGPPCFIRRYAVLKPWHQIDQDMDHKAGEQSKELARQASLWSFWWKCYVKLEKVTVKQLLRFCQISGKMLTLGRVLVLFYSLSFKGNP